jgi:hypothetical protein
VLKRQTGPVALADLLDALLDPEADGRLLLEFWEQAERNPDVRRRLAGAYGDWRRTLAAQLYRARDGEPGVWQRMPEAVADALLALHDGLVLQTALGLTTQASASERAKAVLTLLAGPRPLRAAS